MSHYDEEPDRVPVNPWIIFWGVIASISAAGIGTGVLLVVNNTDNWHQTTGEFFIGFGVLACVLSSACAIVLREESFTSELRDRRMMIHNLINVHPDTDRGELGYTYSTDSGDKPRSMEYYRSQLRVLQEAERHRRHYPTNNPR